MKDRELASLAKASIKDLGQDVDIQRLYHLEDSVIMEINDRGIQAAYEIGLTIAGTLPGFGEMVSVNCDGEWEPIVDGFPRTIAAVIERWRQSHE